MLETCLHHYITPFIIIINNNGFHHHHQQQGSSSSPELSYITSLGWEGGHLSRKLKARKHRFMKKCRKYIESHNFHIAFTLSMKLFEGHSESQWESIYVEALFTSVPHDRVITLGIIYSLPDSDNP